MDNREMTGKTSTDLFRDRVNALYTAADQSVAHRMDNIERVLANARTMIKRLRAFLVIV